MKVELTQKELRKLIGVVYADLAKKEDLLNSLVLNNPLGVDIEELKDEIEFNKKLYEKLGSHIEF